MARIEWDKMGEKFYETGLDRGVLYLQKNGAYTGGVPWNGLTAFNESPSGAESNPLYANNAKYLTLLSAEEYGFTLEAFTYPEEFAQCDGSAEIAPGVLAGQQARVPFGFSCRTLLGNDTENTTHGYKLHIVYGAVASPSERAFATTNDSPEAITFSWECDTTPVNVAGHKPTSCLTIDSTKCDETKLKALEDILYGTESDEARLPLPDEIITLMKAA